MYKILYKHKPNWSIFALAFTAIPKARQCAMQTVTIISDWGNNSHYLPILKGRLNGLVTGQGTPYINLVELSSSIRPFDICAMCFIVKNAYNAFPKGTLHLLGVISEPYNNNRMVLASYRAHYFLGVDDGRFPLIFDSNNFVIKNMPPIDRYSTFTFPFYAVEAAKTVQEGLFDKLEDAPTQRFVKEMPAITESSITGKIVFIDSFGNAITNITAKMFMKTMMTAAEKYGEDIGMEICIPGPYLKINDIARNYDDVGQGEHLALFNSAGYLELAINRGNFAHAEEVETRTEVNIVFNKL